MIDHTDIKSLFDAYINERKFSSRLSVETLRGYTEVFKLFATIMPEVQVVRDLSTEMLVQFFKRLQTRERLVGKELLKVGVTDTTIRTYWSKLNSFACWLVIKGVLDLNPLERISPPKVVYDSVLALDEDQVRRIYTAINLHTPNSFALRRDTAMISLLFFCGLRLGEFISLEVRDIDIHKRLLTVRGTTSKARKVRLIPIHPTLLFHLKDYLAERNKLRYKTQFAIVSSKSDNGLTKHGLKNWVKRLCIRSGVKFHLHQWRHTFACNLAAKNVSAIKIQKLLGHSSLNMTMSYLRSVDTDEMHDDIGRLSM
ncbi:MAG: site-specific integrase [Bacteroidetes bacterium]|nr:site-specific integrase [Bacteroidota bacterium]